ncbi:MAG TPA: MarR family transcriptional regulator [Solirubrobacteraceae bacterium]|nr:MarR family transcriptional regulator [Solirubrobacteraceae bacterium]
MTIKAAARPETDLAFLLSQASHALVTELTVRLAELGITPRSHCVLSKAMAGELTQTQVAEQCALDKTTMVVTLDALEHDGLAERRPSTTDRRARIIAVTEAGERVAAAADAIVALTYSDVLAALPERHREPFLDSLTLLVGGRLSTVPACEKPPRRRAPRPPVTVPQ